MVSPCVLAGMEFLCTAMCFIIISLFVFSGVTPFHCYLLGIERVTDNLSPSCIIDRPMRKQSGQYNYVRFMEYTKKFDATRHYELLEILERLYLFGNGIRVSLYWLKPACMKIVNESSK